MAVISQFQSNIGIIANNSFISGIYTANYIASLNDANGTVTIGIANVSNIGNVVVMANTNARSNTTGALQVAGGVGLRQGNLVVGGTINSLNGPFVTVSYNGANATNQIQMQPGDIVYASQDQNNTGNYANVAFGATITVTNGSPNIRVGSSSSRVPDGVYKFFGKMTAGTDGGGLYRRIS